VIARGRVDIEAVIYSDKWRDYYNLVDVEYAKYFRDGYDANQFVLGDGTSGIFRFWSHVSLRHQKFVNLYARFQLALILYL
jgi:transposase